MMRAPGSQFDEFSPYIIETTVTIARVPHYDNWTTSDFVISIRGDVGQCRARRQGREMRMELHVRAD